MDLQVLGIMFIHLKVGCAMFKNILNLKNDVVAHVQCKYSGFTEDNMLHLRLYKGQRNLF